MFNKLRPYLCWNSVAHQNAIGQQNDNIQEGDGTRDIGAVNSTSDETYLPRAQVYFQKLSLNKTVRVSVFLCF